MPEPAFGGWSFHRTRREVDRVGRALAVGPLDDADTAVLEEFVAYCLDVLDVVVDQLSLSGRVLVPRQKNLNTIREKIQREGLKLSQIQDIVGCRHVMAEHETRLDQRRIVDEFISSLSDFRPRIVDRIRDPRQGYRAIHIIAKARGIEVEIQVRTHYQHAWAQVYEWLGDLMGRGIRYGAGIDADRVPLRHLVECESLLRIGHDLARHVDSYEMAVDRIDEVRLMGIDPGSGWIERLAETKVTLLLALDEFGQAAAELDARLNAEDHAP